jgi:hypothetical protein
MRLEDEFHQAVEGWREHCERNAFRSDIRSYLDCDAYREIVSMGPGVLPLIRKELGKSTYEDDPGERFLFAVKEIIGDDFSIPEEIRGYVSKMFDFTKRWLDENIDRYVD